MLTYLLSKNCPNCENIKYNHTPEYIFTIVDENFTTLQKETGAQASLNSKTEQQVFS